VSNEVGSLLFTLDEHRRCGGEVPDEAIGLSAKLTDMEVVLSGLSAKVTEQQLAGKRCREKQKRTDQEQAAAERRVAAAEAVAGSRKYRGLNGYDDPSASTCTARRPSTGARRHKAAPAGTPSFATAAEHNVVAVFHRTLIEWLVKSLRRCPLPDGSPFSPGAQLSCKLVCM